MQLDAECLFEAKVENVERLALSLGLRLPQRRGGDRTYTRTLIRNVLKKLEDEQREQARARSRRANGRPRADAFA